MTQKINTIIPGFILAMSLLITGCGKDSEINSFDSPSPSQSINMTEATGQNTKIESKDVNTELSNEGIGALDVNADYIKEISTENEAKKNTPDAQPIVWLGDSLTQGSLGNDNDNLPGAPYETLKKLVDVPVEGYGLYFHTTHDIFWVYTDSEHLNQTIDPKKTYIFWVGSNDWAGDDIPNTETSGVIAEIDRFLNLEGSINNYIVIGTTARYELGPDMAKTINRSLKAKYNEHYLDILEVVGPNGYGPDKIHLTQEAYDAVALAVYNKLISLGYI